MEKRPDARSGILRKRGNDVAVKVERDRDLGMPEPLADYFRLDSGRESERC